MDRYCICYSMYFCYCTHGCVCQLVIKENADDDDDDDDDDDLDFAVFVSQYEFSSYSVNAASCH